MPAIFVLAAGIRRGPLLKPCLPISCGVAVHRQPPEQATFIEHFGYDMAWLKSRKVQKAAQPFTADGTGAQRVSWYLSERDSEARSHPKISIMRNIS